MALTLGKEYAIYSIKDRMFRVDFYCDANGTKPVASFIKELDVKLQAKVIAGLQLLEEYGNKARQPLSKELSDGIFEFRTTSQNRTVRILYFFDRDKLIIATNAFIKKTQKTPRKEIEYAKKLRRDYHRRKEDGTYE